MAITNCKIIISVVVLFFLFIILRSIYYKMNNNEKFVNIEKEKGVIKWKRNKCNFYMNETLQDVLKKQKIEMVSGEDNDWKLYFPCGYNEIDREIEQMK